VVTVSRLERTHADFIVTGTRRRTLGRLGASFGLA